MAGMERRPDADFGFARRSQGEARLLSVDAPTDGQKEPDIAKGGVDPEPVPTPASEAADDNRPLKDDGWVVRPKMRQRSQDSAPPSAQRPRRRPGYTHHETAGTAPSTGRQVGGKRWLALGLAGVVYVTGIAGLWSMIQTFDGSSVPPLTPADGVKSLPPLDPQIDLQDAHLDGPIIPRFRPDLDGGDAEDVATSDFQKQS